jgi:hypothetical protein
MCKPTRTLPLRVTLRQAISVLAAPGFDAPPDEGVEIDNSREPMTEAERGEPDYRPTRTQNRKSAPDAATGWRGIRAVVAILPVVCANCIVDAALRRNPVRLDQAVRFS